MGYSRLWKQPWIQAVEVCVLGSEGDIGHSEADSAYQDRNGMEFF